MARDQNNRRKLPSLVNIARADFSCCPGTGFFESILSYRLLNKGEGDKPQKHQKTGDNIKITEIKGERIALYHPSHKQTLGGRDAAPDKHS